MKLVCEECEGTNLKMGYWINPNTEEILEPIYKDLGEAVEFDMLMCLDCGDQTIITKKHK